MRLDWAFRIDTLTVVMLVVVNTVSALVHIYSIGYMHPRSASAALLCLSVVLYLCHADAGDVRQSDPDVLRLGRAWVLASYLLDRLLVQEARRANAAAAIKAFIVNRMSAISDLHWAYSGFSFMFQLGRI